MYGFCRYYYIIIYYVRYTSYVSISRIYYVRHVPVLLQYAMVSYDIRYMPVLIRIFYYVRFVSVLLYIIYYVRYIPVVIQFIVYGLQQYRYIDLLCAGYFTGYASISICTVYLSINAFYFVRCASELVYMVYFVTAWSRALCRYSYK